MSCNASYVPCFVVWNALISTSSSSGTLGFDCARLSSSCLSSVMARKASGKNLLVGVLDCNTGFWLFMVRARWGAK